MINEVQAEIWKHQGGTTEERRRNEALLDEYDPGQYPVNITGYNGMNLQEIALWHRRRAVRTRVGGKGNYKAGMALCNDGAILLAACRKINEQATCRVLLYRSTDCGTTWKELEVQTELWGKEPALAWLSDGTLLMTVEPLRVPVADVTQTVIYRSEDDGASWRPHVYDGYGVPRNFLVEANGNVAFARPKAPGFLASRYEKEGKAYQPSSNLELWRSTDSGDTWEITDGEIQWDHDDFAEISLVRLPDGRLLASLRGNPQGTTGEGEEVTWLSESADEGATWSSPRIMSNVGEVHFHLLLLRDGRLLATYSNYHLPFGSYAIISDDLGSNWHIDAPIQLSLSNGIYVGWPVSLQLADGSIITSYTSTSYAQQEPQRERTVCETVRWTLPARE